MDIQEQLSLLQKIKVDCRIAIKNKNVDILSDTPFSYYSESIRQIELGQGSELSQIKEPLKRTILENLDILENETQ